MGSHSWNQLSIYFGEAQHLQTFQTRLDGKLKENTDVLERCRHKKEINETQREGIIKGNNNSRLMCHIMQNMTLMGEIIQLFIEGNLYLF